jgi:hypothetical protein
VLQFVILAGSAMRFLRPWAPNAPSITLEAPKRVPMAQKGDMVVAEEMKGWLVGKDCGREW